MTALPLIYLAAPLFNTRERLFNDAIAGELSPFGRVFLPQRDGRLFADLVRSGMAKDIAEKMVFDADIKAMRNANLLVAVLDGGHIDEGVAFEIGVMNGFGQLCVGLQTDVRRALPSGNNPMISQGLFRVFDEIPALVNWVCGWRNNWAFDDVKDVA